MAELNWNINGKYFKDFGVFVSDSKGIMDEPNQKKTDTYDWAEYHGLAPNLQSKPKFEAREFELSCWVKGGDWLEMRNNFDAIMAEFRKAGKQRLTLDIFGEKTYVWDVNINGKIELKKTLQKGVQVGVFTLKLIEYSPIKKILTTTKPNLQLAFNSPKWVEVNIDGAIESHKGVVNINKTLPNRVLTSLNFSGRNLALNSKKDIDSNSFFVTDFNLAEALKSGEEYTFSVRTKVVNQNPSAYFSIGDQSGSLLSLSKVNDTLFVGVLKMPRNSNGKITLFRQPDDSSWYHFESIKIEKGNKATDWTPAPEDMHFISIAGNIEEITNLTTNADVLWERL